MTSPGTTQSLNKKKFHPTSPTAHTGDPPYEHHRRPTAGTHMHSRASNGASARSRRSAHLIESDADHESVTADIYRLHGGCATSSLSPFLKSTLMSPFRISSGRFLRVMDLRMRAPSLGAHCNLHNERNAKSDFWAFEKVDSLLRLVVSRGFLRPKKPPIIIHLTFSLGRFCIPHVADSNVEKPESGENTTRRPA